MKYILMMSVPSGGPYQISSWPEKAVKAHMAFMMQFAKKLTASGELPETPDDAADPADDLDRARQRRALLIALRELPERERAIVSLRYGAELNASEIAATVGLEPTTIRKILERARTRLGARIEALLRPDGGMS